MKQLLKRILKGKNDTLLISAACKVDFCVLFQLVDKLSRFRPIVFVGAGYSAVKVTGIETNLEKGNHASENIIIIIERLICSIHQSRI